MQKYAQICTIFETAFLLRGPSTGGAWTVCTKCTKRGMFSAQARRGSKRALWGREGVGIPRQKPPAGRALSRCIRRARRQKPARMALAASGWGYDVKVLRSGRHGREWWCCSSVQHRREWRCGQVLLRDVEQGVRVEADHLFTKPVVNMLHRFHHRRQLVDRKDFRRLLDVAE